MQVACKRRAPVLDNRPDPWLYGWAGQMQALEEISLNLNYLIGSWLIFPSGFVKRLLFFIDFYWTFQIYCHVWGYPSEEFGLFFISDTLFVLHWSRSLRCFRAALHAVQQQADASSVKSSILSLLKTIFWCFDTFLSHNEPEDQIESIFFCYLPTQRVHPVNKGPFYAWTIPRPSGCCGNNGKMLTTGPEMWKLYKTIRVLQSWWEEKTTFSKAYKEIRGGSRLFHRSFQSLLLMGSGVYSCLDCLIL